VKGLVGKAGRISCVYERATVSGWFCPSSSGFSFVFVHLELR
jgi:hypothetical protein